MKKFSIFVLFFIPIVCNAQLSFSPIDTLVTHVDDNGKGVLIYDYDRDSIDDIIYIKNHQLFLRLQRNGNYTSNELIFSHSDILSYFSQVVDIDGDNYLDFFVLSKYSILLFKGTADGIILYKTIEIDDEWAFGLKIIDFDQDDDFDIVYNSQYNTIVLLKNNGDDQFTEKNALLTNPVGSHFLNVEIFDFDFDGDFDFLINTYINNDSIQLSYFENIGDLEFRDHPIVEAGSFLTSLYLGDMNRDGYQDAVFLDSFEKIHILTFNAINAFEITQTLEGAAYINMKGLKLTDYNNDGNTDIVIATQYRGLLIANGNGDGTVKNTNNLKVVRQVTFLETGNFNNDGNIDLFGYFYQDNCVTVVPSNQQGIQEEPIHVPLFPSWINTSNYVDLDNDGFEDLVIFGDNGGIYIHYGTKEGIESEMTVLSGDYWSRSGMVVDMNNDGKPDFLLNTRANLQDGKLLWIKNNGDRNFDSPIDFKKMKKPKISGACDYNKDGILDIVAYESDGSKVAFFSVTNDDYNEVYTNSSNIINITTEGHTAKVSFGDINQDGWIDIIVGLEVERKAICFYNNKNGGFEDERIIYEGNEVVGVKIGDINNDQISEIFIGVNDEDNTSTLITMNWDVSQNSFLLKHEKTLERSHNLFEEFFLGDYNYDGHIDLMGSSYGNYFAHFFINDGEDDIYLSYTDKFEKNRSLNMIDYNRDNLLDILSVSYNGELGVCISLNNSVFEPAELQSILTAEQITKDTISISSNETDYDGKLIVMRKGKPVEGLPEDGFIYAANSIFGVGSLIGEDAYVVYSGSDSSISVTGLEAGNYYHIAVFEYNTNEPELTIINYLTESFGADSIYIKQSQQLEWIGPDQYTTLDKSFNVEVISSSKLPVEITLESGPIIFTDGLASIEGSGECIFEVSQKGDNTYLAVDSTFIVTISEVTAINKDIIENLKVYPNPFSSQLSISLPENWIVEDIKITSLDGKLVYEQKCSKTQNDIRVALPILEKGVYVLELIGNFHVKMKLIH